ncbi:MAG TPA: LuxR C-terminal-related transcriptional regulator [Ktedonobacteraceae bacterium]|nr:LuxR C-terminal-related transcriptional regulator [Ktedonobacteraceae bacterium]
MPGQNSELLSTKLAVPHPRSALVRREALFTRLDKSLELPLTLLCAPAGSGKTTSASAWIASRNAEQERFKVAWFSLDAGDNDPVRFWRYMIAACQRFDANVGEASLQHLNAAPALPFEPLAQLPFETLLTRLINDLDRLVGQHILVLEDYHMLTSSQLHLLFTYFLQHLPATVHVILLSRSDPPLPLARWRAQGALLELRASDLHFSPEETRTFFYQALPFPLSQEMITRLHERTEGWQAGLHLVALALRRYTESQEQERFITTLTGGYRPFLEYLVSDVLNMQPEPLQTFLLQTSVLKRLTASLCDLVTGRSDSQHLIEQIERANLFLEPLDGAGEWYRYHSLFAEAMQHEALRRLGVEALRCCLKQASIWYEQHHQMKEAIEAALMAEDVTRAALLIQRQCRPLYASTVSEFYTLQRWLEQIPLTVLLQYPDLYLLSIITVMFDLSGRILTSSAQFEKVEALLQEGEKLWQDPQYLQGIYTLRALLAAWREDFKQAGAFARRALTHQIPSMQHRQNTTLVLTPPTEDLDTDDNRQHQVEVDQREKDMVWRSACLSLVAAEEQFFGSLDTALELLLEALELNRQAERSPYEDRPIRMALAEVYIEQGNLHLAAETYHQILAEVGEDYFDHSKALLGLSRLSYEQNMLDAAWQEAQEASDLARSISDEKLEIQAEVVLARVMYAQGQTEQASQRFSELITRSRVHPSPLLYRETLFFTFSSTRHKEMPLANLASPHLLYQGDASTGRSKGAIDGATGQRSEEDDLLPLFMLVRENLLRVRWLLMRDEIQEAFLLLEQCRSKAQQHGYFGCLLEAQMLLALAHFRENNVRMARQIMQEVLPAARSKGYRRLFLDEGESMVALLRACGEDQGERPALTASSPSIEPLSVQEQRVLRLFVAGLSKAEIASELIISINTVKTHLQRIYRKLGVTNRAEVRDAVRRHHLF